MNDGIPDIRWTAGCIALLAIIAIGGWISYLRTFDFIITVRRGRVTYRGKFLELAKGETARFLREEIAPGRTFRIYGWRGRGGVLRVKFRGPLDARQRQRVRNFLSVTIRG